MIALQMAPVVHISLVLSLHIPPKLNLTVFPILELRNGHDSSRAQHWVDHATCSE